MSGTATRTASALAATEHAATAAAAGARDTPIITVLGKAGDLGDQPPLFALAAGTLALGALTRRPGLARMGARMLAAEAVATAIKAVVKRAVDRTRPAAALDRGGPEVGSGRGADDTSFNSFPSGHTAGAVAVAQAIAHESARAAPAARLAAVAIGAVQLPRGRHYLSDVAAGAAIGWIAERIAGAAVASAERAWAKRADADPVAEAEAHPS